MALNVDIGSLRCRLCRRGLLSEYDVYSRVTDDFGVPLPPELCEVTTGYFYTKNTRHFTAALEIAGGIPAGVGHDYRLLAFDGNASAGDLILIGGCFYRAACIRDISPSCRIIDLEVERVATQNSD